MIKMHFFEKSNNSVIVNALKQLLSIRETVRNFVSVAPCELRGIVE